MSPKVQPKIFVKKSGIHPHMPQRRSSLRQSISARTDNEDENGDEDCSPSLVAGQKKRQSPPSPILGHESPPRKRLAQRPSSRPAMTGSDKSPIDIRLLAQDVPQSPPPPNTTPISTLPNVVTLQAEIEDLKIQLLRAKVIDLFQVKNKLVRCMQNLEKVEDDNVKLKKMHQVSNISWHIVQTIFPQVASLLNSDTAKVLDCYDEAMARQAQISQRNSDRPGSAGSKRSVSGEQVSSHSLITKSSCNEFQGQQVRSDHAGLVNPSNPANGQLGVGKGGALCDDTNDILVSKIQSALLGHPSSPPAACPAESDPSRTSGHSRQPSRNNKTPLILPGTTVLPAYLKSILIDEPSTPDAPTATSDETAPATISQPAVIPFSQINAQHMAATNPPASHYTSLSEVIAHVSTLPENISKALPTQSLSKTTTSLRVTIPDSTRTTPTSSPIRAAATAIHLANDRIDASVIDVEALHAENWWLKEQNRKLERRVRLLLNQQSACGA